ncbi:MAG TPA: hypothetical protein VFJ51_04805 [Nitrososphaeraceae archaeon]|nr:hypothetical protein [Nitrososphaeraceae archaeon]
MEDKEKSHKRKDNNAIPKKDDNDIIYTRSENDDRNHDEISIIPEEIDTHFQIYGKHAWEVEYGERCPICDKKIDEYGFCACGGQGD